VHRSSVEVSLLQYPYPSNEIKISGVYYDRGMRSFGLSVSMPWLLLMLNLTIHEQANNVKH
ncbi:MAG: hypothetical protein NTV12_09680, partial [Verrucomicrobia bacterium]|nr:hypothetical protein [Verrucomicrobiota bacterium]